MKIKTLLAIIALSTVTGTSYAGNWFVNIISGNNQGYRNQCDYNDSYAYHMGSNYNNGKGLNPVYPVNAIIYTPWVRHATPVPEHLYRNPRAIVRDYGNYYEVCYANYQY